MPLSMTLLLLESVSNRISSAVIDECRRTAGLIIALELKSKNPRLRDVGVECLGRCCRLSIEYHDETDPTTFDFEEEDKESLELIRYDRGGDRDGDEEEENAVTSILLVKTNNSCRHKRDVFIVTVIFIVVTGNIPIFDYFAVCVCGCIVNLFASLGDSFSSPYLCIPVLARYRL